MSDAVAESRVPLVCDAVKALAGTAGPLSRVALVPTAGSTNSELLETLPVDPVPWPHMSAYVTDHQTAGRGRSGREWQTPAGAALTASFLIRPQGVSRLAYGWAPLVVGLAVVRTLRSVGVAAELKWPNDVVVPVGSDTEPGWGRYRKCVGILCEGVPGQDAIVAGVGINVSQTSAELPVPHATSLALSGASTLDRVEILEALGAEIRDAVGAWTGADDSASIASEVREVCVTIGADVVVDVPSGMPVSGTATGLSAEGGLVIVTRTGEQHVVLAGDVRVRTP